MIGPRFPGDHGERPGAPNWQFPEMGNRPDCREVGPGSIPTEGKLRAIECVNALHAHTYAIKCPHVGLEPETHALVSQTLTPLAKRPGAGYSTHRGVR